MTTALTPTPSFATLNGARLYYDVTGPIHPAGTAGSAEASTNTPPLVLLHAGIADHRMWDPQLPAFANRFQVIRLDLRGFGRSDLPPGPFSWREDLYALLAHLDVTRASLVGCSIGAGVALDAALERPDLVHSLVLVGPGSGGALPQSDFLKKYDEDEEAAQEARDAARYAEVNARAWVDGPHRTPDQVPPAIRDYVLAATRQDLSRDWSQAKHQRLSPSAFTRLEEIRTPTLVIAGDKDVPDVLEAATALANRLPNARLEIIPNTAHLPNLEQPTTFNHLVLDFLPH